MYPDDAELQAIRSMVRDQIKAGVQAMCFVIFMVSVFMLFGVGLK